MSMYKEATKSIARTAAGFSRRGLVEVGASCASLSPAWLRNVVLCARKRHARAIAPQAAHSPHTLCPSATTGAICRYDVPTVVSTVVMATSVRSITGSLLTKPELELRYRCCIWIVDAGQLPSLRVCEAGKFRGYLFQPKSRG